MIGLEYILNLWNKPHQGLAEELGIRKQNINLWISGKQNVTKKHLPKLEEIFKIPQEYFQKELTDIDKLIIQKEKLKNELKPNDIKIHQVKLNFLDENNECYLEEEPFYDGEISHIEYEICKASIIEEINNASNISIDNLELIQEFVLLVERSGIDPYLKKDLNTLIDKYKY